MSGDCLLLDEMRYETKTGYDEESRKCDAVENPEHYNEREN